MNLKRPFTEHPASAGESYTEHMVRAVNFGSSMLYGALACFLHALFPWLCTTVASRTIARLYGRMVVNRSGSRLTGPNAPSPPDFLAAHI
jgi:hypothetical protein